MIITYRTWNVLKLLDYKPCSLTWKRNKKKKHSHQIPSPSVCSALFFIFYYFQFPGPPSRHEHPEGEIQNVSPPLLRLRRAQKLRHDAEHGVVAADARPDLLVVLLGVTHLVELGLSRKNKKQGKLVFFIKVFSVLKSKTFRLIFGVYRQFDGFCPNLVLWLNREVVCVLTLWLKDSSAILKCSNIILEK